MSDRRQKALALSNSQKFAALRAIDPKLLEPQPGKRAWTNVVELIVQIQLSSGRRGCDFEARVLAARFFQATGVSRATLFRAAKIAEGLRLITRRKQVTGRGQQPNLWLVNWDRVVALSKLDEAGLGKPQPCSPTTPLDRPLSEPTTQPSDPESQFSNPESQSGSRVAVCDGGRIKLRRGVAQTATPYRGIDKGLTREEQPPPPTPSRDDAWRREEEELLRLGMRRARPAVAAARSAGCQVDEWLAHRRFWAEHRARWHSPIGVLAHRLETFRPEQPADEGWPPGDPAAETAERRAKELDRYDRTKAARNRWRGASEEERLKILGLAGQQGIEAASLLKKDPAAAEQIAIGYVAPRLRRSANQTTTASPCGDSHPHES